MPTDTLVIWNRNAGQNEAWADARRVLAKRPGTVLYEPVSAADATTCVAKHCCAGIKRIVIAGGDGTVNSVVNGMTQSQDDVAIGVLPVGTANDWCSSLAIPDDWQAALAVLENGEARRLDLIELETRSRRKQFANIATGGNSHRVTASITGELKQQWGAFCYIRGAIDVLGDLESFQAEISFDDGTSEEFDVWNILVANGKTSAGRLEVAPHADLEDGLMDVVIIEAGAAIDVADITARYLFSDFIEAGKVIYRQARRIRIESDPPIKFSIDGDLVEEEPIRFDVIPGAIRVIVGPDYRHTLNDS